MSWFERHLNWTNGIFGHLLVFIIFLIYALPSGAWGRFLIEDVAGYFGPLRSNHYIFYIYLFTALYFLLALIPYLGVNIWYIRMKRQSYKNLCWLGLILIPLFILWVLEIFKISSLIFSTSIRFTIGMTLYAMIPMALIVSAIMMLRLKNNN
jgi:hypothetical protein